MGIVIRKSIFNSIAIYLGIALGAVSTIILFPHMLSTEQYGLTRLFLSLSALAGTFGGLGISNIMLRYFPFFQDSEKGHNGALFFSGLLTLLGTLVVCLLFLFGDDLIISFYADGDPLFKEYYYYLFAFIIVTTFYNLFNHYLKALHHTVFSLFSKDVFQRILIIACILLFYFEIISFRQFMLLFTLSHAVPVLMVMAYTMYLGEFYLKPNFRFLRKRLLKSIANYGMFALLGGVTTIIVGKIDIMMLGALRGLTDVSIYSVAYYIGTVISVPQRSIYQIAIPIISKAVKKNNTAEIKRIYTQTSSVQIIAGIFILMLIWNNIHNLFQILPEQYHSGQWIILIIGFAKLFDMATGINGGIILMSKYYRFDLYTSIFLIFLTITTNFLLIPGFGILGAALATAISILVYNSTKVIFLWFKMGIQPFKWKDLIIVCSGIIISTGISQVPVFEAGWFADLIMRCLLISGLFFGLIYLFGLSKELSQLYSMIRKKK